jgi:hypothetical protein
MIEQALQNELDRRGIDKHVISLVTRVVVDRHDPSFQNPTKPIGPYFERSQYPNLLNIFEGYKQGAKFVNPKIKILERYLGILRRESRPRLLKFFLVQILFCM